MNSGWLADQASAAALKEARARLYRIVDDTLWAGEDLEARALEEIRDINKQLRELDQHHGWEE